MAINWPENYTVGQKCSSFQGDWDGPDSNHLFRTCLDLYWDQLNDSFARVKFQYYAKTSCTSFMTNYLSASWTTDTEAVSSSKDCLWYAEYINIPYGTDYTISNEHTWYTSNSVGTCESWLNPYGQNFFHVPYRYKIEYNLNNGTGTTPSTVYHWENSGATISTAVPTRTGYTFRGWSENRSATTASYTSGSTYNENKDTILYAVWTSAYEAPQITDVSIIRCDSSGTANENGAYAKVSFKWSVFTSSDITNAISAIKVNGSAVSASGTSGTASKIISANTGSNTTIVIAITDTYKSSTPSTYTGMLEAIYIEKIVTKDFSVNLKDATARTVATSSTNGAMSASDKTKINNTKDFIVAESIPSSLTDWHWRKWNSGVAECWKRHTVSSTSDWSANGSAWNYSGTLTFPFTMKDYSCCQINCDWGGWACLTYDSNASIWISEARFNLIEVANSNGTDQTHVIEIYYKGKWK